MRLAAWARTKASEAARRATNRAHSPRRRRRPDKATWPSGTLDQAAGGTRNPRPSCAAAMAKPAPSFRAPLGRSRQGDRQRVDLDKGRPIGRRGGRETRPRTGSRPSTARRIQEDRRASLEAKTHRQCRPLRSRPFEPMQIGEGADRERRREPGEKRQRSAAASGPRGPMSVVVAAGVREWSWSWS